MPFGPFVCLSRKALKSSLAALLIVTEVINSGEVVLGRHAVAEHASVLDTRTQTSDPLSFIHRAKEEIIEQSCGPQGWERVQMASIIDLAHLRAEKSTRRRCVTPSGVAEKALP